MRISSRNRLIAVITALVLGLIASGNSADDKTPVSVFKKRVPQGATDLSEIEQAARDVAKKVIACTVWIQLGGGQGSGVIVSEDGYVLTAAHLIGRPGRGVLIKLPDGKIVKGKTLGMHTVADAGLIKIIEEGKWPYAPVIGRNEAPEVGD